MKRSRCSEEQIIAVLKEQEARVSVADLCRKKGVKEASIYKWKAKFGGMDEPEARRLRTVEDENAKLKRMLAERLLSGVKSMSAVGTVCSHPRGTKALQSFEFTVGFGGVWRLSTPVHQATSRLRH